MSLDRGQLLKDACDQAIDDPSFAPAAGLTHCNQAVQMIASIMGYSGFAGLLADQMVALMASSPDWRIATGSEAAVYALSGGLAVAGMASKRLGEAHGHVTVVYPLGMGHSGSLGRDVPMVANVGKFCGICVSTEAFPVAVGEAEYWLWSPAE